MIAVGDWKGYIAQRRGHQPVQAGRARAEDRLGRRLPGRARRSRARSSSPRRADIFIPAALELEIGVAEAKALKVRLIVEGANGPTDTAAEPILRERGIDVIPDILANSGGVIVSYYEWLQNKRSERWDLEEVEERLAKRMKRTYLRGQRIRGRQEVRLAHGGDGHRAGAHRPRLRRARDLPVAAPRGDRPRALRACRRGLQNGFAFCRRASFNARPWQLLSSARSFSSPSLSLLTIAAPGIAPPPTRRPRSTRSRTSTARRSRPTASRTTTRRARCSRRRWRCAPARAWTSTPIRARTHIHFGVVAIVGFKQREVGLKQFRKALDVQPDIKLTKQLATPELQDAFEEAVLAGEGGGGGGAATAGGEPGGGGGDDGGRGEWPTATTTARSRPPSSGPRPARRSGDGRGRRRRARRACSSSA